MSIFNKPLIELTDVELLDVLDLVSSEVKRRNSVIDDQEYDQEAMKRAADFFVEAVKSVTRR